MEGTRDKILGLLQQKGADTVEGLSNSLGLTSATVRRHLDILQRDRLITYEEVRKKTGRPEYSFSLTEDGHESLPKHYNELLTSLLHEMESLGQEDTKGHDGREILRTVFQRVSRKLVDEHQSKLKGKSSRERLAALIDVLQSRDFFPEVQQSDSTVTINLLNCPFRYVALNTNAVCDMDNDLISSFLQVPVKQQACIQKGDRCCTYQAIIGSAKR